MPASRRAAVRGRHAGRHGAYVHSTRMKPQRIYGAGRSPVGHSAEPVPGWEATADVLGPYVSHEAGAMTQSPMTA
jgi:hypothetical protein